MIRRVSVWLALGLVVLACGDDDVAQGSSTSSSSGGSTTTGAKAACLGTDATDGHNVDCQTCVGGKCSGSTECSGKGKTGVDACPAANQFGVCKGFEIAGFVYDTVYYKVPQPEAGTGSAFQPGKSACDTLKGTWVPAP